MGLMMAVCSVVTFLALSYMPRLSIAVPQEAPWFCHDLDCPRYTVKKTIDADLELRSYEAGVWVSTNVTGVRYDKATSIGFERLYDYISGANEARRRIPMTAPVRVELTPGEGPFCEDYFKVSFFVPYEDTGAPPKPTSADVFVDPAPAADFYVLSYGGRTNERQIIDKATGLLDLLDKKKLPYDFSTFYTAGYDSPFRIFNRHNEIWVQAK